MNFHIMNVEPLGSSVMAAGSRAKFLRLVTDSYAVKNLDFFHKWTAPDFLAGVWRFLSQSFATSKFFK